MASAKDYQRYAKLSNEEVKEQLVSPDGGKFTPEQADYAMQHLNE
ncbi:MAG: Ltp family lipoprotein [Lactobacillus sp.]|nr:Ltp family lipoprotein [Lactobacillus sp.]